MSIELNKTPFPGLLSTLIVDANKDWQGFNITNLGVGAYDVNASLALSANHIAGVTEDHTQYLLLAGRSGGQIAIGGTGSGENLVLKSTSHATRGTIIIKTAAGQSSNLLEFHTSGGVVQGFVDDDGSLSVDTSSADKREFRVWGTAIISSRHTAIGDAQMLIEGINYTGNSDLWGLRTDIVYKAKSGGDPANRIVGGAYYHIHIDDKTNRDLAGTYSAGLFGMQPTITAGNAVTGHIRGFDFYYDDLVHKGTVALVSGLVIRKLGLRIASGVLTEGRYIEIAKTAYQSHAGTITDLIGLDIGDIDRGTNNYAIRTQAGDILLNEGNGQCDLVLKGANYNLIETDSSDDEIWIGKDPSAEISLFGVDPITQRAHVADADGTLADITTKFNQVLANLEALGVHATS